MFRIILVFSVLGYIGFSSAFHRTGFFVYTSSEPRKRVIPGSFSESLLHKHTHAYVFIIHGEDDDSTEKAYEDIVKAYMKVRRNYTFIMPDWSAHIIEPSCQSVYDNLKIISSDILAFVTQNNIPLERSHVIGYSRGAHLAGAVGKLVYHWHFRKFYKITALDPSLSCFEKLTSENREIRLSKKDAGIVNVLFTSVGSFGVTDELGDLNFYANEGKHQPGCSYFFNYDTVCSHWRALQIYNESITSDTRFIAFKCDDYPNDCDPSNQVTFGPSTNVLNSPGKYYFRTNNEPPFALG